MKIFSASATGLIHAMAEKKRRAGERVYNFAAGDPVLKNHDKVIGRAMRQLEKKESPYPPVEGISELRNLVAEWMNTSYSTHFSKDNVLVTCGGKFALFGIIYSLLQSHEEVLIPAPYWVSYPDIVKMAGGTPKIIPTSFENGWKITAQNLVQQMTRNVKMLIFNNACNPTGVLYTREEIAAILAVAKRFGLIVVSDEVYSGLAYEEPGFISCGSFPEHRERVLIVQSCSKNFGMTGWRVGFALGPEEVMKRIVMLQSQSTSGVSVMSQWAAVGALENAEEVNSYVKEAMRKRRDLFIATYNSIFSTPLETIQSGLYAFVPLASLGVPRGVCSVAFSEQVMESHHTALVPGRAFGVEGYVRFAFTESEENIYQGLRSMCQLEEKS